MTVNSVSFLKIIWGMFFVLQQEQKQQRSQCSRLRLIEINYFLTNE